MKIPREALIGGSLALALIFGPGAIQWLRLSRHARALDRRLRELEAIHQQLTDEQQRLASDPVYVEGMVRSTFKMSKPGELVVLRSEPKTQLAEELHRRAQ